MKENVVKNKSFQFAVRVVRLYQFLCEQKREFILSKQLLRSGTSVGAMVREAEHVFFYSFMMGFNKLREDLLFPELYGLIKTANIHYLHL